jgi:hypothetical protein
MKAGSTTVNYIPRNAARANSFTPVGGVISLTGGNYFWAFRSRVGGTVILIDDRDVESTHDLVKDVTYVFGAKAIVSGGTIPLNDESLMVFW